MNKATATLAPGRPRRAVFPLAAAFLGLWVLAPPSGAGETAAPPTISPQAAPQGEVLNGLRWQARPLVIFAPSADSPLAVAVRGAFDEAPGAVRERVLVRIEVYRDQARLDGAPLGRDAADGLRQRFRVGVDESAVVLIGLDGGEKYRADQLDWDAILDLIDSMPMRRSELGRDPN